VPRIEQWTKQARFLFAIKKKKTENKRVSDREQYQVLKSAMMKGKWPGARGLHL
jgi:hypothetical protein